MIRSLQLRAKNLALSRASAIARASPLMGAAWFSSISEAAPNKCYFPACTAAEGLNGWTLTVFLRWPLTNVILWPVSGQASQFGFIKYADTLFNFADDHRFSWWNDVLVAAKMVSCVWCKQMHMITGLWVQTRSLLCWQGLESGGWRQDISCMALHSEGWFWILQIQRHWLQRHLSSMAMPWCPQRSSQSTA